MSKRPPSLQISQESGSRIDDRPAGCHPDGTPGVPAAYDPLWYCPPEKRARFALRAEKAKLGHSGPIAQLVCAHCAGWNLAEVARCTDPGCPLWIRATRGSAQEDES